MTVFGLLDPLGRYPDMRREYGSIEEFLVEWDRLRQNDKTGTFYVYAFNDGTGSTFYIGKGTGNRAHDAERHHHGRLGYYIAKVLGGGSYTVHLLRTGLARDDAELLEALLIQKFGQQLVNWENNYDEGAEAPGVAPSDGALPTYAQMRDTAQALRVRARAAAAEHRLEDAVSVCREALANLSEWERSNDRAETGELERRAATELAARVDLHVARNEDAATPPVPACDVLSDLTLYLCQLGRPDEAQREVDAFAERYPHGSFREYEIFDRRSGRSMKIPVTKREQATLRRIRRALNRDASRRTRRAPRGSAPSAR